jgi:DNA-binding Lrp family transcriptional regulator
MKGEYIMKAYVIVNIRPGEIREVIKQVRRVEGVIEANMTFGPYDAVVIISSNDITHLGRILSQQIQPIPGVTQTLTCLAVEE